MQIGGKILTTGNRPLATFSCYVVLLLAGHQRSNLPLQHPQQKPNTLLLHLLQRKPYGSGTSWNHSMLCRLLRPQCMKTIKAALPWPIIWCIMNALNTSTFKHILSGKNLNPGTLISCTFHLPTTLQISSPNPCLATYLNHFTITLGLTFVLIKGEYSTHHLDITPFHWSTNSICGN